MGLWKLFADDFNSMYSDFVNYFRPPKIVTAEEFIIAFEKAEEDRHNSKEETLKRLGLDKIPCKLSTEDFNGINNREIIDAKYQSFRKYLEDREEFEREWK